MTAKKKTKKSARKTTNLETVAIEDLHIDPSNVRTHSSRNIEAIKSSLARFGQQKPVVVDGNNTVIAGNGTLDAAQALGWTEIAVMRSELTGTDRTAFAIADNRTTDLSEFDDSALAEILAAMQQEEDFDAAVTGFSAEEIDELIAQATGRDDESDGPSGDEPPIPEAYQVVVVCDSEVHQQELYERLTEEGLECRVLTL